MFQPTDYRPTKAIVDMTAIQANIVNLTKLLPNKTSIIAVVKADGYGHGAVQVARAALQAGASMLATATPDEALQLRKSGIEDPVLVMGPSPVSFISEAVHQQITLTVPGVAWINEAVTKLADTKEKLHVHVKIDSGMGRIGIRDTQEAKILARVFEENPTIQFDGAFTHFACADEKDSVKTAGQFARFIEVLNAFPKRPDCVHAANSAAALRFPEYALDAVRFGIGMYGVAPSDVIASMLPFPLQRALRLETKIALVKQVSEGETISYGSTYKAKSGEWIATLPVGYADGLNRALRGQDVLVRGKRVPIVGTICMDQCMIRLAEEVPEGEPVVFIGSQGNEEITMEEWANRLGTIPYEIAVTIAGRVQRQYVWE